MANIAFFIGDEPAIQVFIPTFMYVQYDHSAPGGTPGVWPEIYQPQYRLIPKEAPEPPEPEIESSSFFAFSLMP